MRSVIKLVTLLLTGAFFPINALAYQDLVGEYRGHVKQVDGYGARAGDPCVAKIAKSDLYGGSLSFSLNNADTIVFEMPKVSAAMKTGKNKIQLKSKPHKGQDAELVYMVLRKNGSLLLLRLSRVNPQSQTKKFIACGELLKE
jgi:hypothetical protein